MNNNTRQARKDELIQENNESIKTINQLKENYKPKDNKEIKEIFKSCLKSNLNTMNYNDDDILYRTSLEISANDVLHNILVELLEKNEDIDTDKEIKTINHLQGKNAINSMIKEMNVFTKRGKMQKVQQSIDELDISMPIHTIVNPMIDIKDLSYFTGKNIFDHIESTVELSLIEKRILREHYGQGKTLKTIGNDLSRVKKGLIKKIQKELEKQGIKYDDIKRENTLCLVTPDSGTNNLPHYSPLMPPDDNDLIQLKIYRRKGTIENLMNHRKESKEKLNNLNNLLAYVKDIRNPYLHRFIHENKRTYVKVNNENIPLTNSIPLTALSKPLLIGLNNRIKYNPFRSHQVTSRNTSKWTTTCEDYEELNLTPFKPFKIASGTFDC